MYNPYVMTIVVLEVLRCLSLLEIVIQFWAMAKASQTIERHCRGPTNLGTNGPSED